MQVQLLPRHVLCLQTPLIHGHLRMHAPRSGSIGSQCLNILHALCCLLVRIAMILTQSGIPGRNPRVLYGCYPAQSLSPFPFRSQLPFRPLVWSLYLHPNSLCHIHSLVSSIVFTCSPDLSLCALRFPSDFLWTHVSSPSSLFRLSSI